MKFCEKCWSEKLVQAPGLIICRGCGHSKKVLNVVVNNEVDSGLYGKRHQSFITEKSASKNTMIEETLHADSRWKQNVLAFQKTLKRAAESFLTHHHIQSRQSTLFLHTLKDIWIKYLTAWKQLDLPVDSIFNNPAKDDDEHQVMDPITEAELKEQEEEAEENTSKRRRSTLVDIELEEDPQPALIKEQVLFEKMTNHEISTFITKLTSSMTMNTHPYFKKLLKLRVQNQDIVNPVIRQYINRLYYLHMASKKTTPKAKLSYLKHKKMYLRLSWLRQMVKNRNQPNFASMTQKSLCIYLFMFELLQIRLSIKSAENRRNLKEMISKYKQYSSKFDNKLVNLFLSKLKLLTEYDSLYIQQQPQQGLPPQLTFNLIYSFIHLALAKSKMTFYISQVVQHTILDRQQWLETNYLKINSAPSISQVRKNSIQLLHTLGVEVKESNRGRWIQRIARETGLEEYEGMLKVLVKTLIVDPDWIVNEDIECLGVVVVFLKMMANMDDQANVALLPMQRITSKYNVMQNEQYRNIVNFYTKMKGPLAQESTPFTNLSILKVLSKLRETNSKLISKKKFERIHDLKYLSAQTLRQLKKQDESMVRQSHQHQKHKEIFSGIQTFPPLEQQQLKVTVSLHQEKRFVQFKPYLLNEIPKIRQVPLSLEDITLPCNNYEIITEFRSNYYPLNKNQFMELLGMMKEHRCTIDELYRKVEEIEKHLLIFETQ